MIWHVCCLHNAQCTRIVQCSQEKTVLWFRFIVVFLKMHFIFAAENVLGQTQHVLIPDSSVWVLEAKIYSTIYLKFLLFPFGSRVVVLGNRCELRLLAGAVRAAIYVRQHTCVENASFIHKNMDFVGRIKLLRQIPETRIHFWSAMFISKNLSFGNRHFSK